MKKMWDRISLGAKVGLSLEAAALIIFLVHIVIQKQVSQAVINLFLLGMVIVVLSNIYERNKK